MKMSTPIPEKIRSALLSAPATDLLRKSEERFRLITETIEEVFWVAEVPSGRTCYMSPAYNRIWGRAPDPLYDNDQLFFDDVHPDDRERVFSDHQLKKSGKPFEHEYRIIRPDGTHRWIWDRGYPVRGDEGQVKTYVGVSQDITEKKQAAEEKSAFQTKLLETNKMTALGMMVSGLGHEVNNPNNNIKLTAHLLERSWKDILPVLERRYREEGDFPVAGQSFSGAREIIPELIAGIRNNARRIEGIIKNLREFTRKGRTGMNFQVDLNAVISFAVEIVASQIKQHTRHFTLELRDNLPFVRGNPQQMEQVVINLVLNAIQALPNAEREVLVSTSLHREGRHVVVTVQDTGAGMPPEVLERLGEPFFSTKLERGGMGLGLTISNFIVAEHGGALEFESCPGKGTTARVTLPR